LEVIIPMPYTRSEGKDFPVPHCYHDNTVSIPLLADLTAGIFYSQLVM